MCPGESHVVSYGQIEFGKKMKTILLIWIWNVFILTSLATQEDRIQINIPGVEEETNYVWRTIIDTKFFEEHNYEVSLPPGDLIETLKTKSKSNQLSDEDFERLKVYMQSTIYKREDYEKGYQKIESQRALLNKMVNKIKGIKKNWHFKEFDQYQVNLTLYGPGGSYDPEDGSILIYTTPEGQFKQYENPANTIIHEIIHIGTEDSIMNKYQVSHPLKERIIDQFVLIAFGKYLPTYRLQSFGDARIDPYLKKKRDLKNLDQKVLEFMDKH